MRAKELFSEAQILTGSDNVDLFLTALNNAVANVINGVDMANCEYEGVTVEGVDNYQMPERMIDVLAVYLDGVPCRRTDYYNIRTDTIATDSELALLYGYKMVVNRWSLAVDNNRLYVVLSPVPKSQKNMIIKGKELPPRIQSLEQDVPLPIFCRDALMNYILYQIYYNKGDQRSAGALQMYFAQMRSINSKYGGILRLETSGSVKKLFV